MNDKLRKQIGTLFLKMSRGAARKKIYALRARQDGNMALASLFSAISQSESAQANRFLLQLRGATGNSEHNNGLAFDEEIPATITLYEQTAQLAHEHHDRAMHGACDQSARVQRMHLSLKKKLDRKGHQDAADVSYHVCRFCGFIMEGKAPERCPVCTAPAGRFQKIDASYK